MNTASARRSPNDLEPVTRDNCTPAQITQGWTRTAARFVESRARGLICHDMRHNQNLVTIPTTWMTTQDQEEIASALPERQIIEQGIVNDLSEYWPVYRRQAIGAPSPTKVRHAGQLERWLEGCDDEQVDHELSWLKKAEDGEHAVIMLPDVADYLSIPSYSEEISDKDFKALQKKADRSGWWSTDDGKTWRRAKKQYWRDSKGNATSDTKTVSYRKTTEAYSKSLNTLRRQLPWVERTVSMYDCAPVFARGRGKDRYRLAGLYVRTMYDVDELVADGWQWIGMDGAGIPRGFSRSDSSGASSRNVYLYEYYFYDYDDGVPVPCVAYCVDGKATWRGDQQQMHDQCCVIDLRDAFGLDVLPVGYFWGMRTGSDDPDFIGRPLLWPLVATIINLEKVMTAKHAFDVDNGFNGYVIPIDSNLSPEVQAAFVENGEPKQADRPAPGEVVYSAGPPIPFVGAQAGPGIGETIAFHSDRLQRNKPQNSPDQRQSGASGHSMLVAEDLEQQAHRQLREGVRQEHQFRGEMRIKFGCAFESKFGVQIPVEANLEHAADASPSDREARGLIEFDMRWVGDVYKITSEFPKVGNLAEAQQYADFKERGLVTWDEFREKLGDEDPSNSKVKRDVEAYYDSPPALLRMDAAVAEKLNDAQEKERLDMELQGLINPEGAPVGAVAPEAAMVRQAATGGAQMPGVGMPNIPASVLGGEVAGPMGQAAQMAEATSMAAVPGGA